MGTLVVGVDAGATSTRCVVATIDGTIVGRGVAGGANKNSSAFPPAASLGAALDAALSSVERRDVRIGVLGAAGSAGAGRDSFRAAAGAAWRQAGLSGEVVTVTDLEVGYAAGTAAPDGVLLLSGTGALAARFSGGVLARRVDGYGWLAGDEGSAVWIGIRALRAALAALDGRGEPTVLVEAVRSELGVPPGHGEDLAQGLLAAGFAMPPATLGRLAPLVSAAGDDPVARRICAAAAAKLLHTFDTVQPAPADAAVLAGSVLLSPGPIAGAVRAGIRERIGAEPSEAADGAAGAAALAIARLTGNPVPADVHASLTGHEPTRE